MKVRTAEEWQQIIENYRASGLSASQFCEWEDIKLKTFYNQIYKQNKRKESPHRFIPVQVEAEPVKTRIQINGMDLAWESEIPDQELQRILWLCKGLWFAGMESVRSYWSQA